MNLRALARASLRHANRAAVLALAVLAAGIVTSFSVELGPAFRQRAEKAGSSYLRRPLHIGGLSIRLFDGRFVVRDLLLEGLKPTDEPFFRAKDIVVSMPLWALVRGELIIESVELSDWTMAVETWPGDRNNFPRLPTGGGGGGKSAIKVTASYVHAFRGQFLFDDHHNWSTLVRNLDITVMKLVGYRGTARSSGGRVTVGQFVPMSMGMMSWFKIEGGKVRLDRMDLKTYGADTIVQGYADVSHWPEMRFNIRSTIDMPKIREIFWANAGFSLSGTMQFQGQFRLFKGGHEVAGNFYSDEAGINRYRFPALEGSLAWTPWRFEVPKANSRFYGGTASYTYLMNPLGGATPGAARLDASYDNVDLAEFSDAMTFAGLRLAGRATGRNVLEWPIGQFAGHTGFGDVAVAPPAGATVQGRTLPARLPDRSYAHVYGDPFPTLDHLPIGGDLHYSYGPEWLDFGKSRVATPTTFVEFEGRTAYGDRSNLPFHVTSRDWQESDRLLAGIMTTFGSRTTPIEMGGMGTFDGVLLKAISKPRVEGVVRGQGLKAWDTNWGTARSRIVVENAYTDLADAVVRKGDAELRVDGRFSMGFPREDKGEEINARFTVTNWPLPDLRHAFDLDEYPMDGKLSGEFHLYGAYRRPFGFGRTTIAPASAYGETLESASASLRFEGSGCRFDGVEIRKSTGTIRGAANITWAGTYSFSADGRQIPVESVDALRFPSAPALSGMLEFTASGSGPFASVEFDVDGRLRDVYIGDEGLGEVSGKIGMRGENVNFELRAGSSRLEASMVGRVNRRYATYPGEITLRVNDASLDPYVRLFASNVSPYARAVVSGTARLSGTLGDLDGLVARAVIDKVDLSLFDYDLRNDGPIDIGLAQDSLVIHRFNLAGENTRLGITGSADLAAKTVKLSAEGDANLGILQAFSGNVRGSGRAQLRAAVTGSFDRPQMSGSAVIENGRLRHLLLPHALEDINGRITFTDNSIRVDDLVAKMGGGNVRFGGRILLQGVTPSQFDLTATGESMQWRYPVGMRSLVDADLALRGKMEDPVLSGTVTIKSAVYWKRVEIGGLELASGAGGMASATAPLGFPLRLDVRVLAPSSLEVDNNVARLRANADLTIRGTIDKPDVRGRVEVEKGDVWFEGRRYVVTHGTFDFINPGKIDPYFDIEAETRTRTPGQTYRVTLQFKGYGKSIEPQLSSDPPLPEVEIVGMLLGDLRFTQDPELRAIQAPNQTQQAVIQSRAARLLASPISSTVGKAVEQTVGLDTFQITPQLTDPSQQTSRLAPGARLTIGKRISDRVYLTYSRSLTSTANDQIILLEFDQSDRLSWILTQNEDKTYALDVRVRRVFK